MAYSGSVRKGIVGEEGSRRGLANVHRRASTGLFCLFVVVGLPISFNSAVRRANEHQCRNGTKEKNAPICSLISWADTNANVGRVLTMAACVWFVETYSMNDELSGAIFINVFFL